MKRLLQMTMALLLTGAAVALHAQTKATLRFDTGKTHQHITGFGGFVCSPQFTYNHMSESEIKKVWGKGSTVGIAVGAARRVEDQQFEQCEESGRAGRPSET